MNDINKNKGKGIKAEIVSHKSTDDLEVTFEDRSIPHPNKIIKDKDGNESVLLYEPASAFEGIKFEDSSRAGEKRMMNCGLEAEIIRYGRFDDIDVRFEDGQIVCHKSYNDFVKGTIARPSEDEDGETKSEDDSANQDNDQ